MFKYQIINLILSINQLTNQKLIKTYKKGNLNFVLKRLRILINSLGIMIMNDLQEFDFQVKIWLILVSRPKCLKT